MNGWIFWDQLVGTRVCPAGFVIDSRSLVFVGLFHLFRALITYLYSESWRRLQFNQFLNSSRRDSQAVGNPAYNEARITHVRKAFSTADVHGRAVMVGAIVSDARFDRMNRRDSVLQMVSAELCALLGTCLLGMSWFR